MKRKALIVWGNWGPYHYARFNAFRAAAQREDIKVEGIQLFPSSGIYAWASDEMADGVHYLDLGNDEMAFRPWLLTTKLAPLVRRLKPDVVFVPSYWHWSLFLNAVSRLAGARIVMMNESHAGTERARGWKKKIKSRIVASFHAGLVGGTPHREFFSSMGLSADKIHLGYDAIDNEYFADAAAEARSQTGTQSPHLHLPKRYFLSLGRFVQKKNLGFVIRAFARANASLECNNTHLVFVGSGETENELRQLCREESLPTIDHVPGSTAPEFDDESPAVHFFGFRQVNENPTFYAHATAFVLASLYEEWGLVVNEAMACGTPVLVSNTVGCAQDLVTHGKNGFTFSPDDLDGLVNAFKTLAESPDKRFAMGQASRERIAEWGTGRFGEGAVKAFHSALEDKR